MGCRRWCCSHRGNPSNTRRASYSGRASDINGGGGRNRCSTQSCRHTSEAPVVVAQPVMVAAAASAATLGNAFLVVVVVTARSVCWRGGPPDNHAHKLKPRTQRPAAGGGGTPLLAGFGCGRPAPGLADNTEQDVQPTSPLAEGRRASWRMTDPPCAGATNSGSATWPECPPARG